MLGALGAASMAMNKALELAVTGAHEHIQKSSTAEPHVFANKFVALVHSFGIVTFALAVLATFPYGSKELLAHKHKGKHTDSFVMHLVRGDVSMMLPLSHHCCPQLGPSTVQCACLR